VRCAWRTNDETYTNTQITGSAVGTGNEWLSYRVKAPVALVTAFSVTPYQAFWHRKWNEWGVDASADATVHFTWVNKRLINHPNERTTYQCR
jgi:hypothetical protein